MGTSQVGTQSGAHGTRRAYYTGYKQDGTTQINVDLKVGDFVCFTYGQTFTVAGVTKQAQGYHVTRPETALLRWPAGVVVNVPEDSKRGGPITIATYADRINVMTNANMTAGTTFLGPQDGEFSLVAKTAVAAIDDFAEVVGIALETSDTSSTAAKKFCRIGGVFGSVNAGQ